MTIEWNNRNKTIYRVFCKGTLCWVGEDENTAHDIFKDEQYDELHKYTYNWFGLLKTRYLIDWR